MANAELREYGVYRANLQTCPPTAISQLRGLDVILPVGGQKRQRCEPGDDVFARSRARESLQQFLQDQPRDQNGTATLKGIAQHLYFGGRRDLVAAEGKRPDAGIDKQAHRRVRSLL